ncbi:DUF1127 domain-containing protein [Bradyrhizobium liaoningense]|uniref:DUF1127 domain-containing protein n=1 Tax=Bradyrhizobium liaoningense TaxID=43992 RepID=UPI001BAA8C53|nr:DUF1127 domain-containing protein [Bradyrhizobium liaoningense]MBR0717758.1 DUF1127 domain-containing protein [Bradyrhizobium liaoningense]
MSTTYSPTPLGQTSAPRIPSAVKSFWSAFQEWRKWERVRANLCDLSDRELLDIGIGRGEIDYVASNRDTDPRGARSAG